MIAAMCELIPCCLRTFLNISHLKCRVINLKLGHFLLGAFLEVVVVVLVGYVVLTMVLGLGTLVSGSDDVP